MRSAFNGYWRFFAGSPGIITPGRYFFVNDNTPHLGDFHYFGSEDWRKGDEPQVVGHTPPPVMGNDKSLGWDWEPGAAPQILPPARTVGAPADFTNPHTYNPLVKYPLRDGIDARCFMPATPCFVNNLLNYDLDNCAFLLVYARLLDLLEHAGRPTIDAFLAIMLGPGVQIDYDDGDADRPPLCLAQTPRNNLVIFAGTHTNELLSRQFLQGLTGPTNFGNIATTPVWWNASTHYINFLDAKGIDYSKPTFLVGHSFGGVVACIVWHRLYDPMPGRILRVITYGCPKPGDERLVTAMRLFAFDVHVVQEGDVLCAVPADNATRAAIQQVFPLIPDAWFTEWKPHHRYLYLRPGGRFEIGPWESATEAQYLAFLRGMIAQTLDQGFTAHHITAYMRSLSLHCPDPELPFDADCYNLLFDTDRFSNGGEVWEGTGLIPSSAGTGLVLGGTGSEVLALGSGGVDLGGTGSEVLALGSGGVELGGTGSEVLALGSGGVELGGLGVVITTNPGPACSSAQAMTLGTVYSWTTAGSMTQQWWVIPLTAGTLYHYRMTAVTWANQSNNVNHGTSCSGLNFLFGLSSLSPCQEYTPSVDENLYITVNGSFFGDTDYTLVVDTGHC